MMKWNIVRTLMLIVLLILPVSSVCATLIPPAGLSVGDTFRWVFVTEGVRDATRSDINDYNTFVASEASRSGSETEGLGVNWYAIASTEIVDARENIGGMFTDPIYNLDGELVALDAADLWDSILINAINVEQFGNQVPFTTQVWTGSWADGTAYSSGMQWLGLPGNGIIGDATENVRAWVEGQPAHIDSLNHFYAISEAIQIPQPVPEPTTMLLFGTGLIGLAGARRKFKK